MKSIKTAFFGVSHPHAATLFSTLSNNERFSCIGFADVPEYDGLTPQEREKNLGAGAQKMKRFSSWQLLLEEKPDLAVVAANNSSKSDICLTLLSEGIPVIVEKPMAVNLNDAKKMAACAEKNHTKVITNWPVSWFLPFRKAKELADAGEVGRIRRVVYRSPATWGPYSYAPDGKLPEEEWLKKAWWYQKKFGGGSILDYACYGTMLSTWIFGHQAKAVNAVSKQFDTRFTDVEDYSAMILDFGEGVGLLEGSWSSYNPAEIPTGPVIYGSDGVIVCDRHSTQVKIYHGRTHQPAAPAQMIDMPQMRKEALAEHILRFMDDTGDIDETLDMPLNLQVMAALSAGIRSAEENNAVQTEII